MKPSLTVAAVAVLLGITANAAQSDQITAAAEGTRRVSLVHHVTRRISGAQDLGPADQDLHLDSMVMLLKPSAEQQLSLEKLLADQQNVTSTKYHHWLTAAELADRFGATSADFETLRGWLEASGFHIDYIAKARNWIMFSGKHQDVTKAFHTVIHQFRTGSGLHYANVTNPEIPAAFSEAVAAIHGLHDFHPAPASHQTIAPHYINGSGYTWLAPGDVAAAYNIKPLYAAGHKGDGVSIAVIGQSDFTMSDITAYRNFFGLPANQPQIIMAGADPGSKSTENMVEAELDLELAGGIAPNAVIKYVNSPDVMISALYAIDNKVAPIITFSYGECETESTEPLDIWRTYIQYANASGITFFASSGDAGPAACDWNPKNPVSVATHGLAVSFPASIPEITAVGGTELVGVSSSGPNAADRSSITFVRSEQAWNESGVPPLQAIGATGGGPSQHFLKPLWQNAPGVPADGKRDLPDISFSAAFYPNDNYPYAICLQGSCEAGEAVAIGGTSASSPVAAGILAVVIQYEISQGAIAETSLGNINPTLYQLYKSSPAVFNDVQAGNNLVSCEAGSPDCVSGAKLGYSAGVGYDLTTGLGTINAYELAKAWGLPVNRIPTSVSVSSTSPECPSTGQSFSATVSRQSGSDTPTGSIYFYSNVSYGSSFGLLGSSPVSGSGANATATVNVQGYYDYSVPVFAVYTGDSRFLGSTSPITNAYKNSTGIGDFTLSVSSPAILQGTPVQISAHLQLFCGPVEGQIDLGGLFTGAPDSSGNVTLNSTSLAPGVYNIGADYFVPPGTNPFRSSNSVTFAITDPAATEYSLSIFAGTGVSASSGDGGPATAAQFEETDAIAVDPSNNKYVADSACGCVRKIDSSGIISTIATGLNSPRGIAAGPDGSVYVSETGQVSRILAGQVTRFAGSGLCSRLYSGEGGVATQAVICPQSLTTDKSGNLFIADIGNFRVYRVSPQGLIDTFAGNGLEPIGFPGVTDGTPAISASISPLSIVADLQGNLLIASGQRYGPAVIFQVKGNGEMQAIAGDPTGCCSESDGPALSRPLFVDAIGLGPQGDLYIVNRGPYDNKVRKLSAGWLSVIAGSGVEGLQSSENSLLGQVEEPISIAADSFGNVYFADSRSPVVQVLQPYNNILNTPLRFVPVTPCRVADTRNGGTIFGATLAAQSSRAFPIPQSPCGIPAEAQAYSLNVTAVPKGILGYLTLWPTNQPQPYVSTLNSDGRVKANAVIVRAGDGGGVSAYVTNPTDVIVDINGYFVPATNTSSLAFYPLPPCRVADTRSAAAPLGGPSLAAGQSRSFPVLSSPCGIPANAQAYSLNLTAVPRGQLGFLSTWPSGQSQPLVSTLNSTTGVVTANAAIVPSGTNGAVSIYASGAADVIIDIDGFFAPAATGGLSLYAGRPCRPLDTRALVSGNPFQGTITSNIVGSNCKVPSTSKAYVVNATVIPSDAFDFLSLWPSNEVKPWVSTLNAPDGAVTSNMAIVPSLSGSLNAFATGPAQLILDLSGYFAP